LKTAVKQSYTVALFCCLINLGLSAVYQLSNLSVRVHVLNSIFSNLYTYAQTLFNIAVIVVFAIFIIMALIKKDIKLSFLLGEGVPKQKPVPQQMPPVYQQPVPPMPQQPMYQQPVPPMTQQTPAPVPQAAPAPQPVPQVAPAPVHQAAPTPQPVPQAAPIPQVAPASQPVQNIICPKCQAVNHAGALFCGSCGNKLS
jgi:hypothetical protein